MLFHPIGANPCLHVMREKGRWSGNHGLSNNAGTEADRYGQTSCAGCLRIRSFFRIHGDRHAESNLGTRAGY